MAVIYAEIAFVNKKGETKKVRFPLEKESYKAYHHPSVPKEWTDRMMLEEYRAYCKERNYQRRVMRMPVGKVRQFQKSRQDKARRICEEWCGRQSLPTSKQVSEDRVFRNYRALSPWADR